jgi:sulfotransferase
MSRIYEYLCVDRFTHDFQHIPQITQEDDSVYGVFGDHKIRPILSQNPDDYLDILGSELSDRIKTQYRWFYDHFNYK